MSISPELFKDIQARSLDSFAHYLLPTNITDRISSNGLTFNGYLWKINHKISMTDLHETMSPANWFQIRFTILSNHQLVKSGLTAATVEALRQTSHYNNLNEDMKSKFESFFTKILTSDPGGLNEMEKQRQGFMKKSLDADLQAIRITKFLLIEILYILKGKGEIAVADAIWDSVRSDKWEMRQTLVEMGCYNSVADFPEREDGQPLAFSTGIDDLIDLDLDAKDGYYQSWIIDRVMRHGCLWSGRLVRVSKDDEFHLHPAWLQGEEEEEVEMKTNESDALPAAEQVYQTDGPTNQNHPKKSALETTMPNPTEASNSTGFPPADKTENWNERIDMQLFKQLMQSMFINAVKDIEHHMGDVKGNSMDYLGPALSDESKKNMSGAALWYFGTKNQWNNERDEEKMRGLRCVFDIDGSDGMKGQIGEEEPKQKLVEPATMEDTESKRKHYAESDGSIFVATPYNARSERLPHSEGRTMSMSWIVQPLDGGIEDKADAEGIREAFCTRRMVKGMWRFLDEPAMRYRLV
jgi:hypothetical protein